jgi:hypothetical protein
VFQAAHHGALNGSSDPFLSAMSPRMVLIPMGDPSREVMGFTAFGHGHPRALTVERFVNNCEADRDSPKSVLVADGQHTFRPVTLSKASTEPGGVVSCAWSRRSTGRTPCIRSDKSADAFGSFASLISVPKSEI